MLYPRRELEPWERSCSCGAETRETGGGDKIETEAKGENELGKRGILGVLGSGEAKTT